VIRALLQVLLTTPSVTPDPGNSQQARISNVILSTGPHRILNGPQIHLPSFSVGRNIPQTHSPSSQVERNGQAHPPSSQVERNGPQETSLNGCNPQRIRTNLTIIPHETSTAVVLSGSKRTPSTDVILNGSGLISPASPRDVHRCRPQWIKTDTPNG
jgi:hypothetical protein